MIFFLFSGYVVFLMAAGAMINRLLVPVFGRGWRIFVAPGVIVHELAHALACVVTGAHVLEINFWKPSGGHVIHTQPRLQIIGPILVSLAPMLVMTFALFFWLPSLDPQLIDLEWTQSPPESLISGWRGFGISLLAVIHAFDWTTRTPWLWLYLLLNAAVTMAPSSIDLANARLPLLALLIFALWTGYWLDINLSADFFWPPVALSLTLLSVTFLAALTIRVSTDLLKGSVVKWYSG